MSRYPRRLTASLGFVFLLLIIACSGLVGPSDTVELDREDSGKMIEVRLGRGIEITLQTIGPGQYATPSISSPAVRFIEVVFGIPTVPVGPTQIFRFSTVGIGNATITMAHTQDNREFSVDIVVR